MEISRRRFLKEAGIVIASVSMLPGGVWASDKGPFFEISLAEWSLHRAIEKGEIINLDFPVIAQKEFGISIVEYVSRFFKDEVKDKSYLNELNKRAEDNSVRNNLIMVGGEGDLGEANTEKRKQAVENHYKWIEAAKYLGCKTIRTNAYGKGSKEEVAKALTDGMGMLCEFAAKADINVVIENHGGYSSDAGWLTRIMKDIGMPNAGILPDFGNFCIKKDDKGKCIKSYDRYEGIKKLMPYAKGISAKSYDFDNNGDETTIDYVKMMKIIKKSGFRGAIGIEYEGTRLSEFDGIKLTKKLLEKAGSVV
jgi:sugar phosphate isomerase/epimerase